MVSLDDAQLHITLSTGSFRDLELLNLNEDFDVWIEKWAAGKEPLEGERGSFIIDSYSRDRYQITGEIVRVDNRPAIRLQSAIDPFIQLIVVPMKWHNLTISIWSSNAAHEAVIEEILASITLPSPAGEAGGTNITSLRSGPGLDYPSFGRLDIGDVVEVVARNETGDWLQLQGGVWVEAQYLTGATASLPVADVPQTPTPTPISASPLAIP